MAESTGREPRLPTEAEKLALFDFIAAEMGGQVEDRESIDGLIAQASIAVFDHYISDGPGYAGSVMVIVWSGGPECHEVFTWDLMGVLTRVKAS